MIFANIDSLVGKNVIGFECGTRAEFDARHGGDPLWRFVDSYVVKFRVIFSIFFLSPKLFYFDDNWNLKMGDTATPVNPPDGQIYLVDQDGAYLTDADGTLLTELA